MKIHVSIIVILSAFTLMAASFFMMPSRTEALSCLYTPVEEVIASHDIIFSGKVLSNTPIKFGSNESAVTFQVIEYWKGYVGKNITVRTQTYAWPFENMPVFFKTGESYLVFARTPNTGWNPNGDVDTRPVVHVDCGRTNLLTSLTEDLAILGIGKNISDPDKKAYSFKRNLAIGMKGADVVALQTFLEEKGFLKIPSSVGKGNFGGLTKRALILYQQSAGIKPASGFFGPITMKRIGTEISGVVTP